MIYLLTYTHIFAGIILLIVAPYAMVVRTGGAAHRFCKGQASLGLLAAGFGFGGMLVVWSELKPYIKPPQDKFDWFYSHMGNMMGGFIASVTAFSAQVMNFRPGVMQWIWPSLVRVSLIIYWIQTHRKKLNSGKPLAKFIQMR